jgi:hypothetical protein
MNFFVASFHNPNFIISSAYQTFSEAMHAAECIRVFTGEPCRVIRVAYLWVTP